MDTRYDDLRCTDGRWSRRHDWLSASLIVLFLGLGVAFWIGLILMIK